jgi:aspartyl-tRNA(Asn)/glutamyl-tRNA(Gln) amidotransferase subunit A
MRGHPTRRGSHLMPDVPDTEDSPAVARLKEAGAVILGKTTTPEFGWIAVGDSPLTGITRNPWNLERTPGGSSAGAAAACAAGIGVFNLGSDGAGSIRIPACFSGVFGIKPTFGLVPAYPPSPMGMLSHHGPITRTVGDAAAMLDTIGRPDPRDPYWLPPPAASFLAGIEDGVRGWKIAFSPDLGYAKVNPEIAAAVAEAAKRFEELGAHVEQVGKIFDSPCEALLTLWGAGRRRHSGRQAQAMRPRVCRGRRGRSKDRRGRLPRRRFGAHRARPHHGRVPRKIRSAADADDAGAGAAGRRRPQRSLRPALGRLVAV